MFFSLIFLPRNSRTAVVLTSGVCAESVEDGGTCELQNVGQTVVWSNAVFCTDSCNEDSSSMGSIYSTHCSPSESQCAAANRTLDVTGEYFKTEKGNDQQFLVHKNQNLWINLLNLFSRDGRLGPGEIFRIKAQS